MKIRHHHKIAVVAALLFWLFSSVVGAHNHICLDGQEPPITIHLGSSFHHLDHHMDDHHQDLDIDIPQVLMTKFTKIDLPLLLIVLLLFVLAPVTGHQVPRYHAPLWKIPPGLRPPLRAPPLSA